MAKLNAKQARFVQEYLKDLNITQAALRAGYKPKSAEVQGSRLLRHAGVAAAVQEGMKRRAKRAEVTQDMVLNELKRVAFSSMAKLADWGPNGVRLKDSSTLDEDDKASVQEVTETITKEGGSQKIKQYDKVRALELLGRHLGMWNDKLKLEDDRPLEEMSDSELNDLANGQTK